MREILFRGKRKDSDEWKEGSYVYQHGCHMIYLPDGVDGEYGFDYYHVNPETVGQFTGLTDKNGKKIFEGDILLAKVYETKTENVPVWGKNKVRTGNKIDVVWTVEYKNFMTSCGYFIYGKDRRFHRLLTNSVIFNNDCEVIGNIHDSPELLEKERGNDANHTTE